MSAPAEVQEQVFSSDEEDLQCIQLRQKISTKQVQMLHLINNRGYIFFYSDKFISTITEHSNIAKNKIELNEKQQLKFALVYLKESEKILEYGANSGKNINKELIITVLHNQASIYQKLWELNSCSDYLEGIIFNYENFIRQTSSQGSTLSKDVQGMPADPTKAKMKQKLARYNLQFCAVNSQLAIHDVAIQAVGKAHNLMVECINGCGEQFKKQWIKQGLREGQIHLRMELMIGLASYDKKIESHSEEGELSKNILKVAHFSLQMWNARKQKGLESVVPADSEYLQHLKHYSIGNIVEIVAIKLDKSEIGFKSMRQKGSLQFDRQFHPYNRIILLSTCFFSKATELRLKASQLFRKNIEEKKKSRQYQLSISYHLTAITIVATFIPANLKYLNQILMSYEKHYGVNLNEYTTVEVESIHKMMELLGIQISELLTETKHNTERAELDLDSKNDYNMKTAFQNNRAKKLDKMKSLKKLTKQLTDPHKKYQHKEMKVPKDKSKDSKTSFSISRYDKKDRTTSRTDKKSIEFRHNSRDRPLDGHKNIPKIKVKRATQMTKSRQKEEKRGTQKHFVDETEELFFCFTKKTKKSGVPTNANSQLRSSSIASNSGRKSSKKSLLSPRNIKMNKVTSPPNIKHQKSPHRKNFGDHNRYL